MFLVPPLVVPVCFGVVLVVVVLALVVVVVVPDGACIGSHTSLATFSLVPEGHLKLSATQ